MTPYLFSKREEITNAITHVIGSCLAVAALVILNLFNLKRNLREDDEEVKVAILYGKNEVGEGFNGVTLFLSNQ